MHRKYGYLDTIILSLATWIMPTIYLSGCSSKVSPHVATEVTFGVDTTEQKSLPRSKPEAVSLLGRPLYANENLPNVEALRTALAQARAESAVHPDDPDKLIWVGRRLGYLWQMQEAIQVHTRGIRGRPDYAPFYRHRGHRYISVWQFDQAVADLERASVLIQGKPDIIESDGVPNERGIPLTTLGFNVWYHLGLAHYLNGNYDASVRAFVETMKFTRGYDDNVAATTFWMYVALRRAGKHDEATRILEPISPTMDIIENQAYHRCLLLFKKAVEPESLFTVPTPDVIQANTLNFGLGFWYLHNGDTLRGTQVFKQLASNPYWPAFSVIAAEAELLRLGHGP